MTNKTDDETSQTVIMRLRRAHNEAALLKITAAACQLNFGWFSFNHRYYPLPLLDFDVICGVLPTIALEAAISPSAGLDLTEELSSEEGLLSILVGPYTTALILSSMDKYSLPPGTAGELANWKKRVTHRLGTSATTFIKALRDAETSSDPVGTVSNTLSRIGGIQQILTDSISDIADLAADRDILNRMVQRATPFESLVSNKYGDASNKAFRAALNYLEGIRPGADKLMNNINDAMNIASVIWASNEPSSTNQLPVFISQTVPVRKFWPVSKWLTRPYSETAPDFVGDSIHLIMSEGLLSMSDNDYRHSTSLAGILENQIGVIQNGYRRLLDRCNDLVMSGIPEHEIGLSDLPEDELDMLRFERQTLLRDWGNILMPSAKAAEFDRVEFINSIISPQVRELLEADSVPAKKQALSELEINLRGHKHPCFDFWEPVEIINKSGVIDPRSHILESFASFQAKGVRESLQESAITAEMTGDEKLNTQIDHEIRMVITPRYVNLPVMAVDSSRQKGNWELGIMWLSTQDAVTLWNVGTQLMCKLAEEADQKSSGWYGLYSSNSSIEGDFTEPETVTNITKKLPQSDQCIIRISEFALSFNIRPSGNNDMEIYLTFKDDLWRPSHLRIIARAISRTAMVHLHTRSYESLLAHLLAIAQIPIYEEKNEVL